MNKSVQVLRLAFLLGSFFNNLGWVENSAVGKRSQIELGAENPSMRRRMMLGIGSEASTSSIWGYLDPASENKRAFAKRHEHKRFKNSPISTLQPAIVLEDGGLSQQASTSQDATSQASDSSALESKYSKRSQITGSPQHGTLPGVKTKIVLYKRKLSEVVARAYSNGNSKIVLSNNGKRSTQRGGPNSKIVLSNGKRSAAAGPPGQGTSSGGNNKIVLSKSKRRGFNSAGMNSKIVLSNGKRSVQHGISSRRAQRDSKIVLSNGKRSPTDTFSQTTGTAAASKSSAIESDIVLGNTVKRSEISTSSSQGHSDSGSSILPRKTKTSQAVMSPISITLPSTGKKTKRYEMDLMAGKFAKPFPIFNQFDK